VAATLNELTALGVAFVSMTEALDLSTPSGRALAGMLAVFAESLGTPANNCPGLNPPGSQIALPDYPVTYLDGGPDGAFCCERENAAVDAAAGTGASDAGTDGGPSDASGE
jgi:hypothetical protein